MVTCVAKPLSSTPMDTCWMKLSIPFTELMRCCHRCMCKPCVFLEQLFNLCDAYLQLRHVRKWCPIARFYKRTLFSGPAQTQEKKAQQYTLNSGAAPAVGSPLMGVTKHLTIIHQNLTSVSNTVLVKWVRSPYCVILTWKRPALNTNALHSNLSPRQYWTSGSVTVLVRRSVSVRTPAC